jgi:CHAT domain-containing protein
MNSSINNKENIRGYLLGRVANDSLLSEIEELLFLDTDFFDAVELEQEELIHDYVFGRLNETDRNDFEKTLSTNTQRKLEVEFAYGLKETAKQAIPAAPLKKRGFLESIRESFKQPAYGGGVAVLRPAYVGTFAVLLIAIATLAYVFLPRQSSGDLAELRSMFKDQRQTEARISGFDYARLEITRGGDKTEEEDVKTAVIKAKLLNNKSYHALGIFYLNQKDFPEAQKKLELALKSGPESADLHNDLGTAYFEVGTSGPAEKKLETVGRALDEFNKALQLNPEKLEALFNRSLALQALEQTEQARESWRQYLQKDPSSKWAEEARKKLEALDRKQSSFKSKEQTLEDFLAAWRKKDVDTAWKINLQTRDLISGVWLPNQLARRYVKAKRDANPGDEQENIAALTYIGTLEKERNADFFISELSEQLARTDRAGIEKLSEAQELFDQGLMSIKSFDNPKALQSFERSSQLFSETGNTASELMAGYWVMQALRYLKFLSRASSKGDEILSVSRLRNYKWMEALVHYFSGLVYFDQTRISRALDSYMTAFTGAKNVGDTLLEQRCRVALIEYYLETGEFQKALQHRFLGDAELYYNEPVTQWRNNLFDAKILLKLKLNLAATEFALESLAFARNPRSGISRNIGSSLLVLEEAKTVERKLDDALSLAGESLAITDSRQDDPAKFATKGGILIRIAKLKSELGRYGESLADYNQAISLFEKVPESTLDNYEAHRGRLMCFRNLHQSADVTRELEIVLSLTDEYRNEVVNDESRQAFFNNEQAVFDVAIEDSLERGENTEAFERAERSKARSLLDMIGQTKSINELVKTVYKTAEPFSADEIRSKIPANSQIVEYALLDDRMAAWVISREGVQTIDLKIDTAALRTDVTDLAKLDRDRNSPADRRNAVAARLYKILIAPLSKFLDPAKTLIIVPDKSLYYVPFAALVTDDNKFLIEQFTVTYSPSSTIFVTASQKGPFGGDRKTARLLSIGDPDFDREEFPGLRALDSARDEAYQVGEMTIPDSRVVFIGKYATREAFMRAAGDAQIVHFAGHYVANPEISSGSKLVFAGKDGGLRMSEITAKKMPNLQLVVLSACETGLDNVMRGEGAIGASRAFLAAGAPVVVASQWNVDSEASAKLMVAFHRNRQQGLNSAAALKSAQLEMINNPAGQFASPYYWAAFGVTGGLEY